MFYKIMKTIELCIITRLHYGKIEYGGKITLNQSRSIVY